MKKLKMRWEHVATMWKENVTLQTQIVVTLHVQQIKLVTTSTRIPNQYLQQ